MTLFCRPEERASSVALDKSSDLELSKSAFRFAKFFNSHIGFSIYSGKGCVSKLLKFYFAFENTQVLKFLQLIGNNVIQ